MGKPPHFRKSPQIVVTHEGELLGEDTLENREIVRRIHACVSACDGISTEELEQGIVQDMRQVIAQVAPILHEKNQQVPQQQPLSISIPGAAASKSASTIKNC
jgi:hypothetical protein